MCLFTWALTSYKDFHVTAVYNWAMLILPTTWNSLDWHSHCFLNSWNFKCAFVCANVSPVTFASEKINTNSPYFSPRIYFYNVHRVQRLIASKCTERMILNDITVFWSIFDKWLSHGVKRSSKMIYVYIKFVHKIFSFRKHFDTVLTEEIRTAKFCDEVFVMPKHLMTKLKILRNYCDMVKLSFCTFTCNEAWYIVVSSWCPQRHRKHTTKYTLHNCIVSYTSDLCRRWRANPLN